jgi:arabinose-5-phosphate isomerase
LVPKLKSVTSAADVAGPSASAKRTIEAGQLGLAALQAALADGLARPFAEAVALIRMATDTRATRGEHQSSPAAGRVIVTGMGKSGHIARKVAATLASTGTPALFVHPAEAGHGDLGMVMPGDVILALSKSGETTELRSILEYSRRFEIKLIAVTAWPNSTLARHADIILTLPEADEACPHGQAPTTSTLMQLALGDALAIALLEERGFRREDFHGLHPGGRLGANLNFVADVMHRGEALPLVAVDAAMSEAIMTISGKRLGCVGIVDRDGALAGIITDGDLRRNLAGPDLLSRPVAEVMTRTPKTIGPDALVGTALDLLNHAQITVLFVVEGGKPVGVVHMHDLLRIGVA